MTIGIPAPPGLNYTCGICGRLITNWSADVLINENLKVQLIGRCCGHELHVLHYPGIGGKAFVVDDRIGAPIGEPAGRNIWKLAY